MRKPRLLFIRDRTTNLSCLVDTGADESRLPANNRNEILHSKQFLPPIKVYGQKTLSSDFKSTKVTTSILGADSLHFYELVPDLHNKCLRGLRNKFQSTGHVTETSLHCVKTIYGDTVYQTLYLNFHLSLSSPI
ncbi:transposon Ty3-I Gag-Pol polyprotein [Nephila pilipes]|uniref:Transposon Ty3-I Gag-Pol polyprotein n=1 Tax=Nephila pilipes TaxID=299642 RepID=A0A8X6T7P0_NEPPI|nr:transposon Ty3-I Gag-Pol polyprotein [Nephila pilipes]